MVPLPKEQSYLGFSDDGINRENFLPAATAKFGRSPRTLIKAIPSKFPSPLPLHLRFLARCTALLVPTLFYLGPALLSSPLFILLFVSTRAAVIIFCVDVLLAFCPIKPWPYFRHFFQLWYELYDFHHNIELPLDEEKNRLEDASLLIYSTHPHGVIPIHGYLWCAFCDQHFTSRYGFGALTDIAMRLPLLRHVMTWLSSTTATKRVLLQNMDNGENMYILPGGVSEIFLACPGRHVIKTPRRGLMKLALQTGALLVPTYVFGANDFYTQLATCGMEKLSSVKTKKSDFTNLFGKFQRRISRFARGGFTFFWGQYFSPLPYEVQCSMVLGDPIEPVPGTLGQQKTSVGGKLTCKQIKEPTDQQIDELLHRYTDALIRLFEQYKDQAGYPNAELILE